MSFTDKGVLVFRKICESLEYKTLASCLGNVEESEDVFDIALKTVLDSLFQKNEISIDNLYEKNIKNISKKRYYEYIYKLYGKYMKPYLTFLEKYNVPEVDKISLGKIAFCLSINDSNCISNLLEKFLKSDIGVLDNFVIEYLSEGLKISDHISKYKTKIKAIEKKYAIKNESIFISDLNIDYSKNFAMFDFDDTIIKFTNKNTDNWSYYRKSVPETLRSLKDYNMVIVTDQSKRYKIDTIKKVVQDLGINFHIVIGMEKENNKPNTEFFYKCFPNYTKKRGDFFVGDAAGRVGDWSDVDKKFAKNLGIDFIPSDQYFKKEKIFESYQTFHKTTPEVVIMVGLPAVGKSYFVGKYFEPYDYALVESDEYKTPKKMMKVADEELKSGKKSVVFVATNVTKEKRKIYIDYAKSKKMSVRCIWLDTSLDKVLDRNKGRQKPVPTIAIYTANKRFEKPTDDEGCKVVRVEYE